MGNKSGVKDYFDYIQLHGGTVLVRAGGTVLVRAGGTVLVRA